MRSIEGKRGRLRAFLTQLMVFLVILELGLQAVVRLGLLDVSLPTYRAANAWSFWADIDPAFGVWHLPEARYRHAKACFDVPYRANAFGMRDAETSQRHPGPRVAVLGDSFAEGWGVADGQRLPDLLERRTGTEHLDFGTSGDFDPVQYWQLYRTLAKRFDHDAVIVMILPNNDFPPGGPADARDANARWVPRLTGTYPNYRVTYPPRRFAPQPRDWQRFAVNLPGEFSLTYRTAGFMVAYVSAVRAHNAGAPAAGAVQRSRYYSYAPDEFDRMRYAIEQIAREAGGRRVLIVTIPRPDDFAAAREGTPPPLPPALRAVTAAAGIDYLDLLPAMQADAAGKPEKWFLSCDGHWSPAGHAEAAKLIRQSWAYYQALPPTVADRVSPKPATTLPQL
ncbi:MAG: SGNH/GDSL hydrolase family protein [Novosphingobium sp.]